MKKNILLVEDDGFIIQMYASKMKDLDFEVVAISNPIEVQKFIDKHDDINFDLILLDLILPDMTGFDLLTWMQKQSKLKDIPIVVLSNLSSQADINQAFSMGVKDYVVKSNYTPNEVMRIIQKHLK